MEHTLIKRLITIKYRWIMKKKIFFAAVALAALASCTSDDFVGEKTSPETSNTPGAIRFESGTPSITRSEGATAAEELGYKFKVYGVKKTGSNYSNVFATDQYSETNDYNASPYWVWYTANTAASTTSNTSNWDYVGTDGGSYGTNDGITDNRVTLNTDQTIKYWDYSADQYEFVAYSATVGEPTITKYNKDGFTISATAAELAGLYVADKLTISTKNNAATKPSSGFNQIGNIVQFTFRAAAAKVRLGIYETIPGYVVQNVSFRPSGTITGFTSASTTNAILSGSFNGSSSSVTATYDVTYASSSPQIAIFTRNSSATDFRSGYFDFGTFASGTSIGESSTSPTWAGANADPSNAPYYQSVLPNTDNVANMILYVDYDLYNTVTHETIKVTGAKAVVPEMYMKWNPNYAYTYLFKISDNTNGTTGTENTSPEGLFPITFDAVTIAATDGQEVGTITTVSTPAITTYQEGSVVDKEETGVSEHGITYAHANGPIFITVNTNGTTNGTLADLTADNIKLYTVDSGTTEADLILTTKTKTAVPSGNDDVLSIPASGDNEIKQGITFTVGKYAKFTPTASTTYAVEYLKIDEVTGVTAGTTVVTGYYTRTGTSAPYTYTKITTADTKAETGTTYYTVVPQYKIIKVASGS